MLLSEHGNLLLRLALEQVIVLALLLLLGSERESAMYGLITRRGEGQTFLFSAACQAQRAAERMRMSVPVAKLSAFPEGES
jgi:hypothetical protein